MVRSIPTYALPIDDSLLHIIRGVLESGVVAQHHTLVSELECGTAGFDLAPVQVILRQIEHLVAINPHVRCSHLVHGQGACLVRADARARPEGLDSLQILHQHCLRLHSQRSQCQRHSHRCQQPLRHVGNNDADREHQIRDKARHEIGSRVDDHPDDEEADPQNHRNDRNYHDEMVNLLVQRCFLRRLARGQLCNVADDCVVADVHDNGNAIAVHSQRPKESDIHGLQRVLVRTVQTTWLLF
mmetsp:Transcript_23049/g.55954  ORF Transcript_23049/g.55954 Transcript_23049/m.55954 type:complete len:242 (-) Transcript_23049:677-1402(-)